MNKKAAIIETSVGLFMLFAFAGLIFLALRVSGLTTISTVDSYQVTAHFANVSGLKERSPVSMAGVTIGRVSKIHFDPESFDAVVTMDLDKQYNNLPSDTSATIFTAGLLGEKYIGLEAGAEEAVLKQGSEIELTQSSLILEQLIGKFLTNINKDDD